MLLLLLYLLVVPNELRGKALNHIHIKESGHLGHHKTILKAEEFFYWPNLRRDVKEFVKECIVCQQFKAGSTLQHQWQELPPVNQPMERISIDLTELGSISLSHKYVLTVIDHSSRFVNLFPMAMRIADNVVKHLEMVVEAYGPPRVLLTDNAREFKSDKLKEWCRENGIN